MKRRKRVFFKRNIRNNEMSLNREIEMRLTFGRRSLLDLRLSNVRQIVERRVFSV